MDRIAFVEVLDRRGRVRERVRLRELPATIGRGYGCDVIVDDRYVSPRHCSIAVDASGQVVLEDLGSLNGLTAAGRGEGERVRYLPLVSGARFRLGETTLRYVESDLPVPPAEPLVRESGGVLQALRRPAVAVAALLVAVAVIALDVDASSYGESDVLGDALALLAGLAVWAGGWSFVTRLLTHRFDYLRHLAWAGLLTVVVALLSSFDDYLRFLFAADELATVVDVAGNAAAFGVLLAGHLAIVPAATRRLRRRWAIASGVIVAGLFVAFLYTDEGLVDDLPFDMPLKSIGAEWAPADSTEDLLRRARETKRAVDELRESS